MAVNKKTCKPKTAKPAAKKASKSVKPNPFAGADDIYITKDKIAVTNVSSTTSSSGYTYTQKTKYYVRNDKNMQQLKKITSSVRVGKNGNRYVNV